MAIDTNNEKFALLSFRQPWQCPVPISADGLDQADLQQLIWDYPGLLWTELVSDSEPVTLPSRAATLTLESFCAGDIVLQSRAATLTLESKGMS